MAEMIKLSINIPIEVDYHIERMAKVLGTSKTGVIRKAYALLRAAEIGAAKGLHIGLTRNPDSLEECFIDVFEVKALV